MYIHFIITILLVHFTVITPGIRFKIVVVVIVIIVFVVVIVIHYLIVLLIIKMMVVIVVSVSIVFNLSLEDTKCRVSKHVRSFISILHLFLFFRD